MAVPEIHIRRMTPLDYHTMQKWLSTPEVLEFYGDIHFPFSLEQVINKYEPRVNGQIPIDPYIAVLNHPPIGFMQKYRIREAEQSELGYSENLTLYGIDQFIGEPNMFNRGFGTKMANQFVDTIKADAIILETAASNGRAIRCYQKCGFVLVKTLKHGTAWLMERRFKHIWKLFEINEK
jgi:aminoglycoside 6'-N-acetyltransferase